MATLWFHLNSVAIATQRGKASKNELVRKGARDEIQALNFIGRK